MGDIERRIAVAQQFLRMPDIHVLKQPLGTDTDLFTENLLEVGPLVPRPLRQPVKIRRFVVMGDEIIDGLGDDLICMIHALSITARKARANPFLAMTRKQIHEFFSRLRALNPEPKGELQYTNPYTLLVAVVLSAQATDKGVNKATP